MNLVSDEEKIPKAERVIGVVAGVLPWTCRGG